MQNRAPCPTTRLIKAFYAARERPFTFLAWKLTKYKLNKQRVRTGKEESSERCYYNKKCK